MKNFRVARGSLELGCALCHLAQYLAPSRQPVDIFGINECISFSFLCPVKSRSHSKAEVNRTIAAGNNNHLHIICMGCCHFYKEICSLLFFFKYVPLLVYVCFFTLGRDMDARNGWGMILNALVSG